MSDEKKIISASPKVRKLAREFGTDIYKIQGSQREGRVSEEDVCLLYTSPSPRDRSLSRMPSSA